ncbi:hypothetical protein QN416_00005, partial [Glaciimonas sp. Cout2]|uniref:hypothetical protein n=1 Tax=Glaciimonas sp. Cout2 TaxID=3048621 RepID=UPI002B22459D
AVSRELLEDMFERSELVFQPDWRLKCLGTRRAASVAVAFFLVTFSWRGAPSQARKSNWLSGHPRQASTE